MFTLRSAGSVRVPVLTSLLVLAPAVSAWAQTAYVFNTNPVVDGVVAPLATAQLDAVRAKMGAGVQIFVIDQLNVGSATIDGVSLRLSSTANSTATFQVRGDLNLAAGNGIFGFGSNMLAIDVANNATIGRGAVISVAAAGRLGGAGGGNGGEVNPDQRVFDRFLTARGDFGGFGGKSAGNNREDGQRGTTNAYTYRILDGANFYDVSQFPYTSSISGGNGTTGVNDFRTAAGAGGIGITGFVNPPPSPNGIGGSGGTGGKATVIGGVPGNPNGQSGGDGTAGTRGYDGVDGADAPTLGTPDFDNTTFNTGFIRAGSGGGAGATGGFATNGGAGGSGGGGGAGIEAFGTQAGGTGGAAGDGGLGGNAGTPGAGGGGGGGLLFNVRGLLTIDNAVAPVQFTSSGGLGGIGTDGTLGRAGTAGTNGLLGEGSGTSGVKGGDGGRGAAGARGGDGGRSGSGRTGSGGDIQLYSALDSFTGNLTTDNPAQANAGYFEKLRSGGVNPYRSNRGSGVVDGSVDQNTITPNLVGLNAGAATYGIQGNIGNGVAGTASTAKADDVRSSNVEPTNAFGAVTRDSGGAYVGYDIVNVSNILTAGLAGGQAFVKPQLSLTNTTDTGLFDYRPAGPIALKSNGVFDDATDASGRVITSLAARNTWSTIIEHRAFNVTVGSEQYGQVRTFKGVLPDDGSPIYLRDTGLLKVEVAQQKPAAAGGGVTAALITGTGNKIDSVASGNVFVRAGTTSTVQFKASNIGNSRSLMTGSYSGSTAGGYTNLATGLDEFGTATVSGVGRTRGSVTNNALAVTYSTTFDDLGPSKLSLTANLNVVGPAYDLAGLAIDTSERQVANTVTTQPGQLGFISVIVRNTDQTLVPYAELTRLTVTGSLALATDLGATFSVVGTGFDPTLDGGQESSLLLGFLATVPGTYHGTLLLTTDEGAALGVSNRTYSVELVGTVVPEPASAVLIATGLGLTALRRRRH